MAQGSRSDRTACALYSVDTSTIVRKEAAELGKMIFLFLELYKTVKPVITPDLLESIKLPL